MTERGRFITEAPPLRQKCRYGFDLAHEELQRLNAQPGPLTFQEKEYRATLKATTFFCHYQTVACGWDPPRTLQPIYDTLRWEFYFEGKTLPGDVFVK